MDSGDSLAKRDGPLHLFPLEIMVLWQRSHGVLDPEMQARFLANPILADIGRYRNEHVMVAIQRQTRLVEILAELQAAHPDQTKPLPSLDEAAFRRGWKTDEAVRRRARPTPPEAILWERLRDGQLGGFKFVREYEILGWFADFYCPERRLVIEVDGRQHRFRREEDRARDLAMRREGFRVRRFTARRVMHYTPRVVNEIRTSLGLATEPLPGNAWDSSKLRDVVMRHQAMSGGEDTARGQVDPRDPDLPQDQ